MCVALCAAVLAGLCSWEGVIHPSICPSHCLCVRMVKVSRALQPRLTFTLKKDDLSCYFSFHPFPFSLFPCLSFFVSTLSVCQGSTESCNNTEEEEMKGRKGTCPTFTYSACLFLITLYLVQVLLLCWTPEPVEQYYNISHTVFLLFIFEVMHVCWVEVSGNCHLCCSTTKSFSQG